MLSKRCHLLCRFCREDETSPLNVFLSVIGLIALLLAILTFLGVVTYQIERYYLLDDNSTCLTRGFLYCVAKGFVSVVTFVVSIVLLSIVIYACTDAWQKMSQAERKSTIKGIVVGCFVFGGIIAILVLQTFLLLPWIVLPAGKERNLYCGKDEGAESSCLLAGLVSIIIDCVLFLVFLFCYSIYRCCRNKINQYNKQIESLV